MRKLLHLINPRMFALAVAALARLDVDAAAQKAVTVLRGAAGGHQDLAPMMAAFLNLQGGADKLAAVVTANHIPADAAKVALRAMYALGRTDAGLVAELSKAAGLDAEIMPLDKAATDALIADVAAKGDARARRACLQTRRPELFEVPRTFRPRWRRGAGTDGRRLELAGRLFHHLDHVARPGDQGRILDEGRPHKRRQNLPRDRGRQG